MSTQNFYFITFQLFYSWSLTISSQFPFPLTSLVVKKSSWTTQTVFSFFKEAHNFWWQCRRENVLVLEKHRENLKWDSCGAWFDYGSRGCLLLTGAYCLGKIPVEHRSGQLSGLSFGLPAIRQIFLVSPTICFMLFPLSPSLLLESGGSLPVL